MLDFLYLVYLIFLAFFFVPARPRACLPRLRFVLLTGDLKLSAATDNSLRARIDEATGKLSVRVSRARWGGVGGSAAGLRDTCRIFTHAQMRNRTAAYLHGHVSRCTARTARRFSNEWPGGDFSHILFTVIPFPPSLPPFSLEGLTLRRGGVILPSRFTLGTAAKISAAQVQILSVCLQEGGGRGRGKKNTFNGVSLSFHTISLKKERKWLNIFDFELN